MTTHYALHSVVRKKNFRFHRAQLGAHMKRKHFLGNGTLRLVPDRRLVISEELLMKHLDEFRQKAADHVLEVRTLDGRLFDLMTLKAGPAEPTPPLPHPPLDSIANDKQVGQYIPPYVGDDNSLPQVLAPGEKPALFAQAEQEYAPDAPEVTSADVVVESDAALEAAIEAAQQDATEDAATPAPSISEQVSSTQALRKGGRNRR